MVFYKAADSPYNKNSRGAYACFAWRETEWGYYHGKSRYGCHSRARGPERFWARRVKAAQSAAVHPRLRGQCALGLQLFVHPDGEMCIRDRGVYARAVPVHRVPFIPAQVFSPDVRAAARPGADLLLGKRVYAHRAAVKKGGARDRGGDGAGADSGSRKPVSYTHLEVYKRQRGNLYDVKEAIEMCAK